ncbi:TetR/AcrR family transcriptional regulator [Roseovarius salinarum]|uniref:TetR/AcrR family transcriptional regulator n=1 Tax=Roseovarius salinarum TaxID=1981892 RepID=UPI000C33659D|nr:TetR/AcrR family transcriptional regulator [Roseovarius salinarum]
MVETNVTETQPDIQRDAAEVQPGNVKVTRDDWLDAAMELLVKDGVSDVKILTISNRLGVSRSSFYWYFDSRQDLLEQLLNKWEQSNTGVLIRYSELEAATITEAVCNFFRCIIVPGGFDYRLDFAVREWARRDPSVREVIDRSDTARHAALARMYERFGYSPEEADIRARVLYYQQIGYYTLELSEALETRISRVEGYLYCFTGIRPSRDEVDSFLEFARNLERT